MTTLQKVAHFLQTDQLICNECGRRLNPFQGYHKIAMWPQYAFFTWRWFKQTWFGDNMVLRFCFPRFDHAAGKPVDCFKEFASKERLTEIENKAARQ